MDRAKIGHCEVKRFGRGLWTWRRDDLQRDGARVDVEAMAGLAPALNAEQRFVERLRGGEIADFEIHAEELRYIGHGVHPVLCGARRR